VEREELGVDVIDERDVLAAVVESEGSGGGWGGLGGGSMASINVPCSCKGDCGNEREWGSGVVLVRVA
jgi:hypothetical protein